MARTKACLTFLERSTYPYLTDDARAQMKARRENDLNTNETTLPNVEMARHHIVPLQMIKKVWDGMIERFYKDDAAKVPTYLSNGYFLYLHSLVGALPFNPALPPESLKALKDVLMALAKKNVYHADDGPVLPGFSPLCDIICWTPGNLVIGPERFPGSYNAPNDRKSGRADDPNERIEQHLDAAIADGARRDAARRFKRATQWNLDGNTTPRGGQDFTEFFFVNLRALSVENGIYLPHDVRDDVWERIPPNYSFMLPAGDHLLSPTAQFSRLDCRPLWCRNKTGRTLRQVQGRIPPMPPKGFDPPTGPLPEVKEIDASIKIDGVFIDLQSVVDDDYRKLRRGSVTGVRMGPLLEWIGGKWVEKLELPDFVAKLGLDRLSVVAESGPGGWESWQFGLAVGTEIAGVTMDMILYVEYVKGASFGLAASVALKGKTTGDAGPLVFSGDFSKSGSEWELGVSGGPLLFTDLAAALPIKVDDLPTEVRALIPELQQVGIRFRFSASGTDMVVTARANRVEIALATLSG
ncbi:hypothetical protein AB8O64_35675 (plasmid) [Streptomyces sp. QH1-20]